jgi:hypothetical protein
VGNKQIIARYAQTPINSLKEDIIATLFGRSNEDNQNIYIAIVMLSLSGLLEASEPTSNGLLGLVGLVNRGRGLTTLMTRLMGIEMSRINTIRKKIIECGIQ